MPSTLSGTANGLDLRMIAEQNRAAPGFSDLSTLPGSGVAGDPAALEGKRLGLNTFANTAELTARAAIEAAGGDFGEVEAVEVPFPVMIPMLERGELDAAFLVEPLRHDRQVDAGCAQRGRSLHERERWPAGRLLRDHGEFAANFPNTVTAFQRAMAAATRIAVDEPQRVVDILPTYTTLDDRAAAVVTQPQFVAGIDREQIQRLVDLMVEQGLLDDALELDTIIIPPPEV